MNILMKLGTDCLLLVAVAMFLLPFADVSSVPVQSQNKPSCSLVDPARAALFITYEGAGLGDVRLRLQNNSDCPITIETDDHEPFHLQGETWVAAHYLVPGGRPQALLPGYGWGDSSFAVAIKGGDSVLFRVPRAQFRKGWGVAVPFSYAWENNVNTYAAGVQHLIYFLTRDMPAEIQRRK